MDERVASALLARADVVSEGRASGGIYFGTTDLHMVARGGEAEDVARLLAHDLGARVRLLRLARREAGLRAGPIGTVRAQISGWAEGDAIRVTVDVEAELVAMDARRG